jgi:predicted phage tail protein
MIIKVYEDLENFDEFDFNVDNMRDILSGIKMNKGVEYSDNILYQNCQYILTSNNPEVTPISLNEETFLSEVCGYDNLYIIPETSGGVPAPLVAVIMAYGASIAATVGLSVSAGVTLGTAMVFAAQVIISVGVSMALNGIMQLISPTTSFSSDPAQAQQMQSSLFNGAPIIREQGGSVPLWYGSSYIGGVLISSSISTAEG